MSSWTLLFWPYFRNPLRSGRKSLGGVKYKEAFSDAVPKWPTGLQVVTLTCCYVQRENRQEIESSETWLDQRTACGAEDSQRKEKLQLREASHSANIKHHSFTQAVCRLCLPCNNSISWFVRERWGMLCYEYQGNALNKSITKVGHLSLDLCYR